MTNHNQSNTVVTDEVNVIQCQNINNHINIKISTEPFVDTKYTDIHKLEESVCDTGSDESYVSFKKMISKANDWDDF